MKIVSLDPHATEILLALGAGEKLVGVSHRCPQRQEGPPYPIVTSDNRLPSDGQAARAFHDLTPFTVNLSALVALEPTVVVASYFGEGAPDSVRGAEEILTEAAHRSIKIHIHSLASLEGLFSAYEHLGSLVGRQREGRDLAQRMKSQLLDWGRNMYERLRNKKTTVLCSCSPLELSGMWIPDMVRLLSGKPQEGDDGGISAATSWEEVRAFSPDVIVIAPRGASLEESVRWLKKLEEVPEWEKLPAVKRGEVVFASGQKLYHAGSLFVEGAGMLVSAMAGLDSGYITKRDDFYRLRFLELHRHRFM